MKTLNDCNIGQRVILAEAKGYFDIVGFADFTEEGKGSQKITLCELYQLATKQFVYKDFNTEVSKVIKS